MRTIILFVAVLLVASAVHSEDAVVFEETFSADSLPSTWEPGGKKNAFRVVNGALVGKAAADDAHGPSIGVPIEGHDLDIQFDFKLTKPGYFLFLIDGDSQFHGQAHLLRFAVTPKHVQLSQDRGDPKSKKTQKAERDRRGGKRTTPTKAQLADNSFYRVERLKLQACQPADGNWHQVSIKLRGNDVTSVMDQMVKLDAQGSVWDVPKSRLVFLVGQAGTIHIDNVLVRRVSDSVAPTTADR